MKKQTSNWLKTARDDIAVAKEILDRIDLTNMIAFHSQQAIEKSFKAILEEKESHVPRIHNLITLKGSIEKYVQLDINEEILTQINETYIDSRYPSDLGLLPSGKPDIQLAQQFYEIAENIIQQIEKYLSE